MHAVRLLLMLVVCTIAVACGGAAPASPTGPSALTGSGTPGLETESGGAPPSGLASVSAARGGRHGDDDEDEDEDEDEAREHRRGPGGEHPDHQISGFVTAVGASTLTVRGETVTVNADTVIRHGHRRLTLADIAVGNHVQVRARRDGTTLVATEIKVEQTGRGEDDEDEDDDRADRVSVDGAVAGLTGTCPAVSFTLGATRVTTNAATDFSGDACAALVNRMLVRVRGARQADGSILATRVRFEKIELEGTVSGLTGTCPAITFTVATKTVTTNAATEFKGQACADVANSDTVEVKGVRMADGSVTALKVAEDDDEAEVEGTVSGLTGTCPSITFMVGTTRVTASSSTTYRDGTCASVANGTAVEVKGTRQTDGSIAATRIELE